MRRIISVILAIAAITALLCGCGSGKEATDATGVTGVNSSLTSPSKTNVMVYMVGSDLEAKAGSATKDLEEMQASGVNLSLTNVLVYAGGSPHWHNDKTTKDVHSVLNLTADGFEVVSTREPSSMGDAECLTYFLNYCSENYPTQNNVLIMWDHGSGPVIGYGKDMLFDNDSLTLSEMSEALKASPFNDSNKLDWVGFDACLMASAELCCVWDNYAEYLISSQEIEPSFGWNYSFLGDIGKKDNEELLKGISETYLTTCQDYYKERGYENRDTTLSVANLSYAAELENAINSLFSASSADISAKYDSITAKRVQARTLGKATTGSDYDLIDLKSLSAQLGDIYTTPCNEIDTALEKMIIANSTNTTDCCGMSIYFPFYNKSRYEKDWGKVYKDLNIFPSYSEFLDKYTQTWLQEDKLLTVSSSISAKAESSNQFSIELTDEQSKTYASSKYYVLRRDGEQLYTKVFTGTNVTKNKNTLNATFDGNILYIKNNFNEYILPVTMECDTVGNLTRYITYVGLDNNPLIGPPSDSYNYEITPGYFYLSVDKTTNKVSVSALTPTYEGSIDSIDLLSGKLETLDINDFTKINIPIDRHRYLKRYDTNAIMPYSDWHRSGSFFWNMAIIKDGFEFVMAPLSDGEYYLMYEIQDTQGSKYCSEPVKINSTPMKVEGYTYPDPITVDWKDTDRVQLFEDSGVKVFLKIKEDGYYKEKKYFIEAENSNDFDVAIKSPNYYLCGSNIQIDNQAANLYVPANSSAESTSALNFGEYGELLIPPESLTLGFSISNDKTCQTIMKGQEVTVNLSDKTSVIYNGWFETSERKINPYLDMMAEKQVLYSDKNMEITLLDLGSKNKEDMDSLISVENKSDKELNVNVKGFVFDSIVTPCNGLFSVAPGNIVYDNIYINDDVFGNLGISSIKEASVILGFSDFATLDGGGGFEQVKKYPVKLSKSGKAATFKEGETLLIEKGGIRVSLKEYYDTDYSQKWALTLVNDSDNGVNLELTDTIANGIKYDDPTYAPFYTTNANALPHTKTVFEISSSMLDNVELNTISFKFNVMDYANEKLLFSDNTEITLKAD